MQKLIGKIIGIKKLTNDISQFNFQTNEKLDFVPGQFVIFEIPGEKIQKRAYSITFAYDNEIIFLIKYTGGIGTSYIFDRNIGDEINISGAYGHMKLKENKNSIFLATGIGLPLIICMIDDFFKKGIKNDIKLFFGTRKEEDIYYLDFFKNLKEKNNNFNFKICLSRENKENYLNGYITDFLDDKIDYKNTVFYYCGSNNVLTSLKEKLFSFGVDKNNFIFEAFG